MLDRLELPIDARRTVEFLIRNHLLMSQFAFRRDLDDPHVVKQFADLVGAEERLKMLCLMTLADVGAVSPGHADAVEGRSAVAPLRPRLQPPDARLRRRSAAEGSGRPRGGRRRAARRHRPKHELTQLPQGAAAPLSDALRPRVDLPACPAGARNRQRRSPHAPRASRRRVGADDRHARQAVSSSRTSPACCPTSAWTSIAARR